MLIKIVYILIIIKEKDGIRMTVKRNKNKKSPGSLIRPQEGGEYNIQFVLFSFFFFFPKMWDQWPTFVRLIFPDYDDFSLDYPGGSPAYTPPVPTVTRRKPEVSFSRRLRKLHRYTHPPFSFGGPLFCCSILYLYQFLFFNYLRPFVYLSNLF